MCADAQAVDGVRQEARRGFACRRQVPVFFACPIEAAEDFLLRIIGVCCPAVQHAIFHPGVQVADGVPIVIAADEAGVAAMDEGEDFFVFAVVEVGKGLPLLFGSHGSHDVISNLV